MLPQPVPLAETNAVVPATWIPIGGRAPARSEEASMRTAILKRAERLLALGLVVAGLCGGVPAPARASGEGEPAWARSTKGLQSQAIDGVRIHSKNPGVMYANVYGIGPARSVNGGEAWNRLGKDLRPGPGLRDAARFALDERNLKTVYLVTMGKVYRSQNGGDAWDPLTSATLTTYSWNNKRSAELVYELVVDPSKSVRLLAGTRTNGEYHGGLFESNDSGQTWNQVAGSNLKDSGLGHDAWPIVLSEKTDKNVLVGGRVGLWFSEDRGRKFVRVDPGGVDVHDVRDLTSVVPGTKDVYLADARGVWGSQDLGETWSKKPLLEGDAVSVAFDPRQRKRLYAVLRDRGLLVSEDARHLKWTSLGHADLEISGLVFPPKDPKAILATSHVTGLSHSADEGKTFTRVTSNMPIIVPGIACVAVHPGSGAHLALTEHGIAFASADRGASWEQIGRLGIRPTFLEPHGADAQSWFAGGQALLHTADGGKTWTPRYSPDDPEDEVVALQAAPDGTLFLLLSRTSAVLASKDAGKTWTPTGAEVEASATSFAAALAVDPRNPNHLLVATRSMLVGAWSPNDAEGGPYESLDGGKTWTPLREGLYLPKDKSKSVPSWNRGQSVAFDPATGVAYYAAADAGLFALARGLKNDKGEELPEAWVGLARWEVPSPTVTAMRVAASADGADSLVLVQAEGDNSTRAFVEAKGSALAEALLPLRGVGTLKEPLWTRRPDPGARLTCLSADVSVPGRFLAGDIAGEGGVLIFEKPGAAPTAPSPTPTPAPAPTPAPTPKAEPPEGLLAFSASSDFTVRVWDVRSGKAKQDLRGHSAEVRAVALAPDESLVATGGEDKSVRLYSGNDGTLVGSVPLEGRVTALVWSPDSKRLYAALEESFAIVEYEVATRAMRKMEGHTAGVTALALAPDGSLWSVARDKTLRGWDVKDCRPLPLVLMLPAVPLALAISVDGTRLFVAGKEGVVRSFGRADGQALGQATVPSPLVAALAVCPMGKTLYVSGEGVVRSFDPETLAPKVDHKAGTKAVLSLAVSHDGTWLLAGDEENGLWLWERGDAVARWSNPGAHTGPVNAVALTPDVEKPAEKPTGVPPGDKPPEPAPVPAPGPAPEPTPAPAPAPPGKPGGEPPAPAGR
jgi:photosystem II stability/assembly factor-like uncharacterized protein